MAYPAGFSSDEDDFNGFLSDYDSEDEINGVQIEARIQELQNADQPQLTMAQKLNNLYYAIMNGNVDGVISLIEDGTDVNCVVRDGWSPILLAASIGNPDIVRELIRRGADVNSNRDKYTVLMATCNCSEKTSSISNCLDVVSQLIEHGAAVDAITRTRKTALMFAASNGRIEIVRKLLTCANIHAEDNQGWNALFWAVNDNKVDAVKVLLEAGLNFEKMDVRGKTPISYAEINDYQDILDLFPIKTHQKAAVHDVCYEIETVFDNLMENQKPQFYPDVCSMLYGMKCESLTKKFSNINLLDFLCLDDEKLKKLNIILPYQRQRILSGLYKYHKYLYKQRSVPVVSKDSVYSTIDISCAILSAVRQLISMEASIRFISNYNLDIQDKKLYPTDIVRGRIRNLRKTATTLNSLIQMWDNEYRPADLITIHHQRKMPQWMKWLGCLSIVSVTIILTKRIQIHNTFYN